MVVRVRDSNDGLIDKAEAAGAEIRRKTSAIKRGDLRWALQRMPKDMREEVIASIPINPVKGDRDRRLARDLFERQMSDDEIAESYGLTKNGAKTTIGLILDDLVKRPIATEIGNDFLDKASSVPPMSTSTVKQSLFRLNAGKRREIAESIPINTWKIRDVRDEHIDIFLEYMSDRTWSVAGFLREYNRKKPPHNLKIRRVEQVISHILERIAAEPQLVDSISYLSGQTKTPVFTPEYILKGSGPLKDVKKSIKPQLAQPALPKPIEGVTTAPHPDTGKAEVRIEPTAGGILGVQAKPEKEEARKWTAPQRAFTPHERAMLNSIVGDSKAFCRETGIPEEFLFSLELDRLSKSFSRYKVKTRSALAAVTSVMWAQANLGGISLTANGIASSLDILSRVREGIEEIGLIKDGPEYGYLRSGGKGGRGKLTLNLLKAAEITDESIVTFSKKTSDEESGPRIQPLHPITFVDQISAAGLPAPKIIVEHPTPISPVLPQDIKPVTPTEADTSKRTPPQIKPHFEHAPASPKQVAARPLPTIKQPSMAITAETPIPARAKPPAIKPAASSEKPTEKKAKDVTSGFSDDDLDLILVGFRAHYKDNASMWSEAGIKVRPSGAIYPIIKSEEDVKTFGMRITTAVSYLKILPDNDKVPFLERTVDLLERAFDALDKSKQERGTLPRLAFYRTLAKEIADGDGISSRETELGLRFWQIGVRYDKDLIDKIPDSLLDEYGSITAKYSNLAKELYSNA
jgi:hypothetical protein